jgi:two-component system phosphate regulon sensor histidine kinase PhoR
MSERRLVENEERFRRTISALPEGIVLIDASFQIEWCNPVAEHHLGLSLRRDAGLRLTNLVRDPAFVAYMTSVRADEPLTFRPLGSPGFTLSLVVIDFEPTRSIVVTRDVTQSERVDAMRRDFVANVSHELRTPLTVVNGFLETMLDSSEPLSEVRRHHLRLMHEQATRMHRLVEDLLMLSRLEAGDMPDVDDVIDMPHLVRACAEEAKVLSGGKHTIKVSCDAGCLRGSRDELRSALGNLVSNAIRYTPAGGEIDIRWVCGEEGTYLAVRDTGIGIASEHLPRLTERFYRVDKSRSRETGGTGLGLAIVKHVLLRHQGKLEVESQPGRGSEFKAILPADRRTACPMPLASVAA